MFVPQPFIDVMADLGGGQSSDHRPCDLSLSMLTSDMLCQADTDQTSLLQESGDT